LNALTNLEKPHHEEAAKHYESGRHASAKFIEIIEEFRLVRLYAQSNVQCLVGARASDIVARGEDEMTQERISSATVP
jgi:hypothetical protein